MGNQDEPGRQSRHLRITDPSPWVSRFAPAVRAGGTVLDLACGGGRHARHFLDRGHPVVALDRTREPVADLDAHPRAEVLEVDLETPPFVFERGEALADRTFACVLVTNYLFRPLFRFIVDALEPGGMLLYETFARGNEAYTRPRNPDHLLLSGELLDLVRGRLQVVAYEHGVIEKSPCPGVIQRICAINDLLAGERDDRQPPPHPVYPVE